GGGRRARPAACGRVRAQHVRRARAVLSRDRRAELDLRDRRRADRRLERGRGSRPRHAGVASQDHRRVAQSLKGTAMFGSSLNQIAAVTAMNLRNVRERLGSTLVALVGVAGVVTVVIGVLSIAAGFRAVLDEAGSEDVAIVLRGGA